MDDSIPHPLAAVNSQQTFRKAIVDARLDAVKQMLSGTRLTIGTISRECGFENPNGLKMLFKRETGMTMRDSRRRPAGII
jgi:AraC-like DNA-binding protein